MTPRKSEYGSFDYIWEKAIQPVSMTVLTQSDPDFAEWCGLRLKSAEEWRPGLCDEYHRLRRQLKDTCYGVSSHHNPEEKLDGKKIAAVLCAALISKKGFQFNTGKAREFTETQLRKLAGKPLLFNRWAVSNVYINYKLAYLASLQLVYLTMMWDLLDKAGLKDEGLPDLTSKMAQEREEARKLARQLNKLGHLAPYPQPPRGDGFDVNIIIGLARMDMSVKDLDMFMFAMQLYQIEEHTIDILKHSLSRD